MNRKIELDILKGICILLIVLVHCGYSVLWFDYLFVYGFYFVAGYTFKDKPLKQFIKSKVYRLYFPFVISCLFAVVALNILSLFSNGYYSCDISLHNVIKIILFCIPHGIMSASWFVFPLFIILFLYYFINKILKKWGGGEQLKNSYIILAFSFITYAVSYCFQKQLSIYVWNNCGWIMCVCTGLFIFSFGRVIGYNIKIEDYIFNSAHSLDIFLLSTVMLYIIYAYCHFGLSAREGICTNFICNTIVCTFGMIFLLYLSKKLSNSTLISSFLSVIGRHSMTIMHFHLLAASIVTINVHFILGYPYPETWSFSYVGGWIGLLNFATGICLPLIFSIIYDQFKSSKLKAYFREY